jgi:hypothetical protein
MGRGSSGGRENGRDADEGMCRLGGMVLIGRLEVRRQPSLWIRVI